MLFRSIAAYNGHAGANKSIKIDERSLNKDEREKAKAEADRIYWKIKQGKYYGPSKRDRLMY